MSIIDNREARFRQRYNDGVNSISCLIQYLAKQFEFVGSRDEGQVKDNRHGHELLTQIKVLELLQLAFQRHSRRQNVSLECFPELSGMQVMRGVFSPEFATDSYLWAKYVAEKGLVTGKTVLEMGAGSGVISLYLYRNANPERICAVDVNRYAVANVRANVDRFGIDKTRFEVIESNLFDSIPFESRFDIILWAIPWILTDDEYIRQVVDECDDPVEKALLRSAIDPGGECILKFLSEAKARLNSHGKILLISSDFIPNEMIRIHAESEGFLFKEIVFAKDVTVVKATGMTLDLHHLELTLN